MNKYYTFVQSVTPPFLFKIFKSSALYKKLKPSLKRAFGDKLPPSWNQVRSGTLKGKYLFLFPAGDWQTKMLNDEYDKELFDVVKKLGLNGKTVLDIGSHVGYHSIYFSSLVGPTGKVFAFEPNPFNVSRIKQNIEKNNIKNVTLNDVALSSIDSETDFLFSDNVENGTSSGGFIDESDTFYSKDSYENGIGFKRMKVKTVKVDDLAAVKASKIALIKIDVEGAESLVLEGAMNILKRDSPTLIIEIHSMSNMYHFMDLMRNLGYRCEILKKEADGRHLIIAKKL